MPRCGHYVAIYNASQRTLYCKKDRHSLTFAAPDPSIYNAQPWTKKYLVVNALTRGVIKLCADEDGARTMAERIDMFLTGLEAEADETFGFHV